MKVSRSFTIGFGTVVLGTALLGGCIVAPAPGYYRTGAVVRVAPPAPQVEVIGVAPNPGYVWIGGYWNWVGGRHVWVNGYWGPGRAGYHWVPHTWGRYGGGWRMRPGYWVR